MSTTHTPHPAPRDIEGNPESAFVRCPECRGAVYNLRHQRQAHLDWHDELDADVAAAQERAEAAVTIAEQVQRALQEALGDARRETAELRAEIAELRRETAEATGTPSPVAPLVADWPEDEIAEHEAARAAASAAAIAGTDSERAGEPDPDLDVAPQPTAISAHLAARDDLDDDPYAVDLPGSRY